MALRRRAGRPQLKRDPLGSAEIMAQLRTALFLVTAILSQGCRPSPSTDIGPTQVARAFFDALARSQWDSAAALADSEWLVSYHSREVQLLETVAIAREGKAGPVLGPAGAEIPADTFTARFLRAFGSRPVHGLRGVETFVDLLRLSPQQFLARCFEGIDAFERRGTPPEPNRQVLGQVLENPNRGYVVFRHAAASTDDTDLEAWVLPLVRRRDRWRYVLPQVFDGPGCAVIADVGTQRQH